MSRFFRAADDTSSSSSSEASDSEESDTPAQTGGARTTVAGAPAGRTRFLNSDSDDDDVKRISKSAKDRQYEALEETSNAIKAHLKNNDWSSLREDFDNLNEQLEKCRKKDMVSGRAPPVPEIYIRAIITLEGALKKTLEEKPKMSKTNSVNLNKMKLRVPKNNRTHKDEIEKLLATGKATLYDVVEDDS
jgi:translation initiation factor 3 subunit C